VILDFITKLPPSSYKGIVYDSILVVVDRFTKGAKYYAYSETMTAPELAVVFYKLIVYNYGCPRGIVSDRGTLFTSGYWKSFYYHLCLKLRLSTAYHP